MHGGQFRPSREAVTSASEGQTQARCRLQCVVTVSVPLTSDDADPCDLVQAATDSETFARHSPRQRIDRSQYDVKRCHPMQGKFRRANAQSGPSGTVEKTRTLGMNLTIARTQSWLGSRNGLRLEDGTVGNFESYRSIKTRMSRPRDGRFRMSPDILTSSVRWPQ